jgi:BirA family biotin operon repressor/biotin-[acetyl-CoA-carboxylase] ligase
VAGDLERRLGAGRFRDVRRVVETGSTNSDLLALARDGAPEGVVLVADHQTAGRGRLGRTWEAPPGASLLVSVLLRPPAAVADAVSMAAALAMAEAIDDTCAVHALLKWPNDLVLDVDGVSRKLAGILAEADWPARAQASAGWSPLPSGERLTVVVGIGVNVNWPADVPVELTDVLVACNHLTGATVDRDALLDRFLAHLGPRYDALVSERDRARLLADWRARSGTLGRRVRVDLGTEDVEGTAVDVTAEGHLVVETDADGRRTFAVGDILHLR